MSKPKVVIGVAADGFSVTVDGKHHWINQEDNPADELIGVFEELGCEVEVEEEY